MDHYLISIILGIIEGLTEYLPVSSSAHQAIVGKFLDFTGQKASVFEVAIQLGAILAAVVFYWQRFHSLLFPQSGTNFSGLRGIFFLLLTTFPACLVGLIFHPLIKTYLFNTVSIVCALIAGSLCMLLVEFIPKKIKYVSLDQLNAKMALGIGICQCASLWPGFSRSASTIMGGLILGAQRTLAVEYSFIAAVPIMFAATGYDIIKNFSSFTINDIPFFLLGLLCAFLSALCAIRFFVKLLGQITLIPFALYRLLLALVVFYYLA